MDRSVRSSLARVMAVGVLLLSTASRSPAQDLPLAQVLPDLILRDIVLLPGLLGPVHTAHFSPLTNDPNNPVIGIVQSFNTQMAKQFSTFPLGSSTGGLTYVFDETVGTFRRGSPSFGPMFAERALTIGRRKLSVGFNYQHTSYNTFEGQNLDDGSIKFYLRHQDCCTFNLLPDPPYSEFSTTPNGTRLTVPFEGDIIQASLFLNATTDTTAVFANYGLTDRWDLGLAVPFVRVQLDARVVARIDRLVTCSGLLIVPDPPPFTCAPDTHTFEYGNPNATQTVEHDGHASGIGDVILRTKYRFVNTTGGGLAAAVDVRLPTGNEDQLLGAGGTQAKFLLVASSQRGRVGQHLNLGYTVAQGTVAGTLAGQASASLPDEINYSGGAEIVMTPRLTLMGDIVGRTLRGAGRLDLVGKNFEYSDISKIPLQPGQTTPYTPQQLVEMGILTFPTSTATLDEFNPRPGNLTLLLGTGGVKFNPFGNLLVSASVLFPLTDAGLRSRVTTIIGLDYAF
ncbi:MAG TPA: hypothetical protein VH436_07765 [Vicinamibacterales bacterium]